MAPETKSNPAVAVPPQSSPTDHRLSGTMVASEAPPTEVVPPAPAHLNTAVETHFVVLEKDESHGSTYNISCRDGEPFDTDVEAMIPMPNGGQLCRKYTFCSRVSPDCQVWPGQEHWKQRDRAAKIKRSCSFLARLSRRNRTIVKVLLVVFVIGIAVAIGVGISKPLGAPLWGGNKAN